MAVRLRARPASAQAGDGPADAAGVDLAERAARQSAFPFLKGKGPRISTFRRFAKAAVITIEELVAEQEGKKK